MIARMEFENWNCMLFRISSNWFTLFAGSRREVEDRIIPRSIDADDADVNAQSDDDRFSIFNFSSTFIMLLLIFGSCHMVI